MNRTERVKVIKESATLLAKRDWAEIDLILAQFGLETREDWPTQDKMAYSLEMMKWANDDDSLGEVTIQVPVARGRAVGSAARQF